jgi:hypothetical protein
MKKRFNLFFGMLIVLTILLTSCGNETPILNGEEPFVVDKVTSYNETHSSYYSLKFATGSSVSNNFIGSHRARIVLPNGLYTVGDTIIFNIKSK